MNLWFENWVPDFLEGGLDAFERKGKKQQRAGIGSLRNFSLEKIQLIHQRNRHKCLSKPLGHEYYILMRQRGEDQPQKPIDLGVSGSSLFGSLWGSELVSDAAEPPEKDLSWSSWFGDSRWVHFELLNLAHCYFHSLFSLPDDWVLFKPRKHEL